MKEEYYFVGVDVGTRSVRAALVSCKGKVQNVKTIPISVINRKSDFYEQKSEEIWSVVSQAVKGVVSHVDISKIKGIGFDATCSLVVLDGNFNPIAINNQEDDSVNIIMWMDHRAKEEADTINSKNYGFLKYVGGNVSLEMQMPKLLWLKKNLPECWRKAEHFMDLPDFLTFKATGSLSRSLCSLVCKWSYGHGVEKCGWDETFLTNVGLGDLCRENYGKIGNNALRPGMKVGGISSQAAAELGLLEGTSVGVSIIDAHAGGLALMYANSDAGKEAKRNDLSDRLAMICGTSTCHMSLNCEPLFVKGVWGPYLDAMVPKLWLNEGGQSSTGGLIDHVVQSHPAVSECPKNVDLYTWIEDILDRMTTKTGLVDSSLLTDQIHVYPDFHGNRSPLADPTMKGMISGLSLNCSRENLALLYLATLQSLAYGTKDIVDALASSGQRIETVLMCGGLNRSSKFAQINADVLGLPILIPHTKESVLLGAAILGAAASGLFGVEGDLEAVASVMAGGADELTPRKELRRFHQKKFQVFKKMQSDQREYKAIMNGTH